MSPPTCPSCSAQNRENAKFCRLCGTRLPLQNSLSESKPLETQSKVANNNSVVKVESENALTKKAVLDFIGLEEIRSRLQMFINTLTIRQKQKKIGMSVKDSTNILIFRGEAGTGKTLVAEYFISCLKIDFIIKKKITNFSFVIFFKFCFNLFQLLYFFLLDISEFSSVFSIATS